MGRRASIMLEMLGEWLLEQFEKLEAEELQGVKEIAEMVRMTPKPQARSKPKKTASKDVEVTRSRTDGNWRH